MLTEFDKLEQLLRAKDEMSRAPDPAVTSEFNPEQLAKVQKMADTYPSVAKLFSDITFWDVYGDSYLLPRGALAYFIEHSDGGPVRYTSQKLVSHAVLITIYQTRVTDKQFENGRIVIPKNLDPGIVLSFFEEMEKKQELSRSSYKIVHTLPDNFSPDMYLDSNKQPSQETAELFKKFLGGDRDKYITSRIYITFVNELREKIKKHIDVSGDDDSMTMSLTLATMIDVLHRGTAIFDPKEARKKHIDAAFLDWLTEVALNKLANGWQPSPHGTEGDQDDLFSQINEYVLPPSLFTDPNKFETPADEEDDEDEFDEDADLDEMSG